MRDDGGGPRRVTPRVIIVTASDHRFMPFLRDLIGSLDGTLARPEIELACFDLGLDAADRTWLGQHGATLAVPRAHLGVRAEDHGPALLSFLARPFLPEYFPGFDVYVWIDSDVWLQDLSVLDRYVEGAMATGMAITHERERGYRFQPWLFGWTVKHFMLGYGALTAAHLLVRPHVNAGFFAIRADAPHWAEWARRYQAAIGRTRALVPHDQFALNHALHGDGPGGTTLPTALLDPGCNWICDRGVPKWNSSRAAFCKPYPPYEPIGAMHLAGPAKRTLYDVATTDGNFFRTYLFRGAGPEKPVLIDVLARSDDASAGLASRQAA